MNLKEVAMDAVKEAMAMAAVGEDAAASGGNNGNTYRRPVSPLENCRAKDPMYCPYHGQLAIKKAVEDNLKKKNISGCTVEVALRGKGFELSLKLPKGTSPNSTLERNAAQAMMEAFMASGGKTAKNGMTLDVPKKCTRRHTVGYGLEVGRVGDDLVGRGIVNLDANERRLLSMGEKVDDIVLQLASDPNAVGVTYPSELNVLFGAMEDVEEALNASPFVQADFYTALEDAWKAYRQVRAQMDFAFVKSTQDADDLVQTIGGVEKSLAADYAAKNKEVNDAKTALWGKPKEPSGFSKTNPWAKDYSSANWLAGKLCPDEVADRIADYAAKSPQTTDIRDLRLMLYDIAKGIRGYGTAVKKYETAADDYLSNLYAYTEGQVKAGNMAMTKFQAAFPNGNPKS